MYIFILTDWLLKGSEAFDIDIVAWRVMDTNPIDFSFDNFTGTGINVTV